MAQPGWCNFSSQLPEWKEKSRTTIKEFLSRQQLLN